MRVPLLLAAILLPLAWTPVSGAAAGTCVDPSVTTYAVCAGVVKSESSMCARVGAGDDGGSTGTTLCTPMGAYVAAALMPLLP